MEKKRFSGKRFLSILLVVSMLMGLMPGSVFATGENQSQTTVVESTTQPQQDNFVEVQTQEEYEEQEAPPEVTPIAEGDEASVTVDGMETFYANIDEALAAANEAVAAGGTAETVTLKVLKDATVTDSYLNGFTLNLNGCTLTAADSHNYVVSSGYTTVIMDSSDAQTGFLKSENYSGGALYNEGTLTVRGGQIGSSRNRGSIGNNGTLNVAGGLFVNYVSNAHKSAVIHITGGTFEDEVYNDYCDGTIYISGGRFTSPTVVKLYYGGSAYISGGTFASSVNYDVSVSDETVTLSISGGTFEGGIKTNSDEDSTAYLAEGCVFVDESGNVITGEALKTTTVTVISPEAMVTDTKGATTYYEDVDAALDAAKTLAGCTVTLLQDCATVADSYYGHLYEYGTKPEPDFTLELNGKTLSTAGSKFALYASTGINLVILDSSEGKTGAITSRIYWREKLTIHGGTYHGIEARNMVIQDGTFLGEYAIFMGYYDRNLTVNGGTFQGDQSDIWYGIDTESYKGTTAVNGGTFPGGLQIERMGTYGETAPTAKEILGDGYAYFTEDGSPVFPADDALTTGTETVTVKKQAALAIATDKDLYLMDEENVTFKITVGQKTLDGKLEIYVNDELVRVISCIEDTALTNVTGFGLPMSGFKSGSYNLSLRFIPTDTTIAEGKSNTVTFTVEKIPNENLGKHIGPEETRVTYDGTVKAAQVRSIYTQGSNNFYLAPESYTLTYWQGETQVAEPINVGIYTVKLTMAESDYYQAADNVEIGTLVIEQSDLTLDMLDYTVRADDQYNGNAFRATATMKSHITAYGEMKLEYQKDGETERATAHPIVPGTYTVYVSVTGGENVKASEVTLGSFTIEKAGVLFRTSMEINGEEWKRDSDSLAYCAEYEDQTAMRVTLSLHNAPNAAVPTGTVELRARVVMEDGEYGELTTIASAQLDENGVADLTFQLNPGEYVFVTAYSGDEHYIANSRSVPGENRIVITPTVVTLTPSGLEQIYDGTAKTITFTNNTRNLDMDDFTVTYYQVNENMGTISKANRAVAAGHYLYVVELKEEHKTNYTFANPIIIDGDALPEGTCDNAGFMDIVVGLPEAQEPIYFIEGAVTVYLVDGTYSGNTLVNPNNTVPTYTSSNPDVAEVAPDGTVTLKRTGTVTIFATSEKEGTTPVRASYTLTIEKKNATITVNGLTTTYGEAFTLTADMLTVTGCALEDLDLTGLTYTGYTVGQGVGTYYITPAGLTSETYDLTFAAGTLTVQTRAIDAATITVTAAAKVYDGTTAAELTATLPEGAALAGDKVTVTAEGAYTAAAAGTTEATVTSLTLEGKDAANYILTGTAPATAEGKIEKATATFTTESQAFTYDGTAKALDIVAKTNNGLTAQYTVQYSAEPVLPGTYTVSVTLADTVNYVADCAGLEGKTLTITAAKQQSFTVSGLEDGIRYGDVKTLIAENAQGEVTFVITEGTAATMEGNQITAIGIGKVVITATSVKEGFEDKAVRITVTVGKRLITAEVSNIADRAYDGTVTVSAEVALVGIINEDTVSVSNVAEVQTPNIGENKTVTIVLGELEGEDAALYELTTETLRGKVNITARAIDASQVTITAAGKIYDGTTNAELTAILPEGAVLAGDQVSITAEGAYTSANAGTTTANITALTLGGADARNYVLAGNAPATANGEITQAAVTFTAASRTVSYDGYVKVLDINAQTNNGLVADYTVSYSTADGSAPVLPGTYTVSVTLTDTVNYVADCAGLEEKTLTITAAKQQSFTVSGLENGIRYGDVLQLTAENAEGEVTFAITEGTAATMEGNQITAIGTGKVVITATSVKEGFEDKTVRITVTVGKRLITAEVGSIADRAYDGTTVVNATVNLVGLINNDDVMAGGIIAEVMTPGAGENKTVSITISGLAGEKAELYELTTTTFRGTVNITPKTVEAIAFTVADKYYDGTTAAEIVGVTLTGILGSDQVTATAKAEFSDANAGENKTVTLADVTLTGADARNYWFADTTTVTVNAPTIHKTLVTVFCPETTTYTYDGTAKTVYLSVLANGMAFNGYTVSYTMNGEGVEGEPVNVGIYDVVITLSNSVNYELAAYSAKLVIEPATQEDLDIQGIPDRVYYGDSFAVSVPGTEGTVTWEITGAALEDGTVTANEVGTITITATVKLANYEDQIITRTVTAYPRVLTATATATGRTYNGRNDVEVTISLSNVAFGDNVTATAQAQMATSDAGTDKLVYVSGITLSDTVHYTLETTTLQTSVDIARIVLNSITVTAMDKVYDGTDKAEITITGSSDVLSGDEITVTGTGRFASANAGKQTVTVTATGITGPKAQNYALAKNLTGTTQAEILPATVSFEVGTATFFYDGTVKTVEVTAKLDGKVFTDFTVSYDVKDPTNVGIYTVTVTLNDSRNYTGAPAPFTMEILPADQAQLLISGMPGVVDYGRVFRLTTNAHEMATVTWSTSDETIATVDENGIVTIVDVNREVTITATASMENYKDATATITFTPVAKQVTFRLDDLVATYDGTVKNITVEPSVEGLTDYTVTYTDEKGREVQPINAGVYQVEVTTIGNKYVGHTIATLVIHKGTLAGILSVEDWVYGQTANEPVYTLSAEHIRPKYTYTGAGLKDGKPYGAGHYTVTATFTDKNHETLTLTAEFEITKAMLTVTATDAQRAYGETNPNFTVSVTGFAYGEDIRDLLVIPTATTTATTGSDVGQYPITAQGGRSENYDFTYMGGMLIIVPAEGVLTITGPSNEVTIGQELYLQANMGTIRPQVIWSSSDESVAVIDENGKVTIVGAGEATITAKLNERNYVAEDATFRLYTTQKIISLLPKATVFTYSGTVQSVEFLETQGFIPVVGENVKVSYTMTTDAQTTELRNAGTYVAVYEITDPAYAGSGTFTVYMNKAKRTLRPADLEEVYGEANPVFTIDPNGLLGEDVTDEVYIARVNAMFDFACEAGDKSLEGTYAITMTLVQGHSLTEDPNYDFVIAEEPGTLIIRSITGSEECPTAHFTDLDSNAWYHTAVDYVVGNSLMNGISDTLFAPRSSATRGMIVMTLYRLEGEPEEGRNIFTDVSDNTWYARAIAWAAENGIVLGYGDDTFRPNQSITREEMAVIMHRYAAYKDCNMAVSGDQSGYEDLNQVSDWAMDAMVWANATGLIRGRSETTLAPRGTAIRVELATILMRLIEDVLR